MKAATISEIKNNLKEQTAPIVLELCLRLARYKKENKELLTYLLFEAHDPDGYIKNVKEEMITAFKEINTTNLYWTKKSLRKILRTTNKYIRYTGSKTVEVELLLYYCQVLKESGISVLKSAALIKLYEGQVKKIETTIESLHEDLQYEYKGQLNALK
ncbi:MAG TPA: hypothetical protein VM888_13165 [Chitinophagaceae bacterium]|nr:hypothetical protein [Chitinophagaceae bacterium]